MYGLFLHNIYEGYHMLPENPAKIEGKRISLIVSELNLHLSIKINSTWNQVKEGACQPPPHADEAPTFEVSTSNLQVILHMQLS